MYKIQRKQTIKDTLVIESSAGKEELRLDVHLHVDDAISQYNRLHCILGEATAELAKDPTSEKCLTAYGLAVMALFDLVFGEEGEKKLMEYYENRYSEMLEDVAPFISDRINPQMNKAMRERAKKFKSMAKR